uniref:Ankyrin 2, isoform V n=1 Tax=Drosophila melanogaster TaxID=7227 RepID=M9PEN3_DROME|nr:ankyrin 2, isoform V [Drosophila melanogaster]AGB94230.1 ankyrin 2, isoform V [Drosophila melanogaster]|eukprot:NP_001261535.1 ankyrin 2, isoform V [Drosophila melanogaster]
MAQFVTHIQPTLMEASQGHVPHHHGHQVGVQHSSHLPHSGHNMPSPPTHNHHHAHGHGHHTSSGGHHGGAGGHSQKQAAHHSTTSGHAAKGQHHSPPSRIHSPPTEHHPDHVGHYEYFQHQHEQIFHHEGANGGASHKQQTHHHPNKHEHCPTGHQSAGDGNTSFLRAARAGNLERVLEHLKNNIDINTSNANGLNALHLASKDGHIHVVSELLRRGAIVDSATKKGNTALHIASLAGQEEVVKLLLEHNASVNVQSQNGFTPLYMAAQENHDAVVRLLLSNGANQSLATEDGFTPLAVAMQQGHDKVVAVLLESDTRGKVRLPALHIAAKKDDVKAATLLLDNDHNPDVTSKSGFTPLHIASHYGNQNIANLLIQKGADVNYSAKHNISPLHVAAKWGKTNMVSLLLEKGGNIEAKTRDGLTPLHCAARSGHEQVVDMLLERGAPISAKTKNGLAPLHMAAQGEHVDAARILLYHRAPVDEVTVDYLTALHVAAHCGHVRVAKLLLDRNADANARALNGFTPLHIACKKNRLKVVELLLRHGASISATTESGLTPLHVAAFMGCMNIVIYLLQHDASPDVPTVRGETPLHLAARANQTDIIRILLRNGAQVDARAREQQTPLHIASRLGNVDIVMLLLQHGAQVDATTKDMYTALHIAAKEGQDEVAAVLIENGAALDAATKKGFTPLHLTAKYGHIKVAQLLLQKEADVDAQGKNGVTPLHVACHYNNQQVALLLLEKGASPHATAKNGHTPLHIAARKNQMDIATTLLEYGALANAESKAGFTPLHLSSQEGHAEISNLLIEHKAAVNHPAKNGLTPMHLCAQEDNVNVAEILEKNGANIDMATKAGYTPLHVASHFGQANMVRFLLQNGANVDAATSIGYTPLHQTAQQGHCHIVNLLLEHKANANAQTVNGQTPLHIARKLGYISVLDSLKTITKEDETAAAPSQAEEKYRVVAPEAMHESFMSDSEEEGGEDNMLSDQPYRYLTVDEMKSLGDDSLPIDVTRDERMDSNRMTQSAEYASGVPPTIGEEVISPHKTQVYGSSPKATVDGVYIANGSGHDEPPHVGRKLSWKSFLVSFLVDARGGAMRGCRHSGVRMIIPSRSTCQPTRVTCRYVKPQRTMHPPQLMEGEALASRVLELGPCSTKFIGPVVMEVPHFASLRGKEREIIILRSDNGETWREHTIDNSEEIIHDVLQQCFEPEEIAQLEEQAGNHVCRFVTYDFPQYFAVVSRIRQEVHAIGPEGGMVSSTVVPQVQAVFPQGALTKKIKVGLQAQPVDPDLTAKLLGRGVAVSPIVTVEPRRRKFHKAITLSMPAPKAHSQGMINQYSGNTPTLRLLCSITGGPSRAQWEDVTGSTPLTFVNDCVSFTTTVSARFWLMDCRNISDATKMATELYKEVIHVPFIAKFVVFAKKVEPFEAKLRVFCMTDDREDKTLEKHELYTEVAKSRDVEVLEGKPQYIEMAGNLVPVTKSGDQLQVQFKAFRENRLPFTVRVKDQHADIVGRTLFMKEPKVAKGEPPQQPICILNIVLPEAVIPDSTTAFSDRVTSAYRTSMFSLSKHQNDHYIGDIRIVDLSNLLGKDWIQLAPEIGINGEEIDEIINQNTDSIARQAQSMIRLYKDKPNYDILSLETALKNIGRDDIMKKCKSGRLSHSREFDEADLMKNSESVEELVRRESKRIQQINEREEVKYSAEEKEVEESESDEEAAKRTVAERREKIVKRLSIERSIPASTQKKEITREITEIKRKSLIEDKKAHHESEILMQLPADNVIIKTTTVPDQVIKMKMGKMDSTEVSKSEFDKELTHKFKTSGRSSEEEDQPSYPDQTDKIVQDISAAEKKEKDGVTFSRVTTITRQEARDITEDFLEIEKRSQLPATSTTATVHEKFVEEIKEKTSPLASVPQETVKEVQQVISEVTEIASKKVENIISSFESSKSVDATTVLPTQPSVESTKVSETIKNLEDAKAVSAEQVKTVHVVESSSIEETIAEFEAKKVKYDFHGGEPKTQIPKFTRKPSDDSMKPTAAPRATVESETESVLETKAEKPISKIPVKTIPTEAQKVSEVDARKITQDFLQGEKLAAEPKPSPAASKIPKVEPRKSVDKQVDRESKILDDVVASTATIMTAGLGDEQLKDQLVDHSEIIAKSETVAEKVTELLDTFHKIEEKVTKSEKTSEISSKVEELVKIEEKPLSQVQPKEDKVAEKVAEVIETFHKIEEKITTADARELTRDFLSMEQQNQLPSMPQAAEKPLESSLTSTSASEPESIVTVKPSPPASKIPVVEPRKIVFDESTKPLIEPEPVKTTEKKPLNERQLTADFLSMEQQTQLVSEPAKSLVEEVMKSAEQMVEQPKQQKSLNERQLTEDFLLMEQQTQLPSDIVKPTDKLIDGIESAAPVGDEASPFHTPKLTTSVVTQEPQQLASEYDSDTFGKQATIPLGDSKIDQGLIAPVSMEPRKSLTDAEFCKSVGETITKKMSVGVIEISDELKKIESEIPHSQTPPPTPSDNKTDKQNEEPELISLERDYLADTVTTLHTTTESTLERVSAITKIETLHERKVELSNLDTEKISHEIGDVKVGGGDDDSDGDSGDFVARIREEANILVDRVLEESVEIIESQGHQANGHEIAKLDYNSESENYAITCDDIGGVDVIKSPTIESMSGKSFDDNMSFTDEHIHLPLHAQNTSTTMTTTITTQFQQQQSQSAVSSTSAAKETGGDLPNSSETDTTPVPPSKESESKTETEPTVVTNAFTTTSHDTPTPKPRVLKASSPVSEGTDSTTIPGPVPKPEIPIDISFDANAPVPKPRAPIKHTEPFENLAALAEQSDSISLRSFELTEDISKTDEPSTELSIRSQLRDIVTTTTVSEDHTESFEPTSEISVDDADTEKSEGAEKTTSFYIGESSRNVIIKTSTRSASVTPQEEEAQGEIGIDAKDISLMKEVSVDSDEANDVFKEFITMKPEDPIAMDSKITRQGSETRNDILEFENADKDKTAEQKLSKVTTEESLTTSTGSSGRAIIEIAPSSSEDPDESSKEIPEIVNTISEKAAASDNFELPLEKSEWETSEKEIPTEGKPKVVHSPQQPQEASMKSTLDRFHVDEILAEEQVTDEHSSSDHKSFKDQTPSELGSSTVPQEYTFAVESEDISSFIGIPEASMQTSTLDSTQPPEGLFDTTIKETLNKQAAMAHYAQDVFGRGERRDDHGSLGFISTGTAEELSSMEEHMAKEEQASLGFISTETAEDFSSMEDYYSEKLAIASVVADEVATEKSLTTSTFEELSSDQSMKPIDVVVHRLKTETSPDSINRWSIPDVDTSSSSESFHRSFDKTQSRPLSSDLDNLVTTTGTGTSSDYQTAREFTTTGRTEGTEYISAVSTLGSSSLDSQSETSANLASIDVSELSETLVASSAEVDAFEAEEMSRLRDLRADDEDSDESVELPGTAGYPSIEQQSLMKRSQEMIFKPKTLDDEPLAVQVAQIEEYPKPKEAERTWGLAYPLEDSKVDSPRESEKGEDILLYHGDPRRSIDESKLASSLDEGSILSVSMSSTSNIDTVVENFDDIIGSAGSSSLTGIEGFQYGHDESIPSASVPEDATFMLEMESKEHSPQDSNASTPPGGESKRRGHKRNESISGDALKNLDKEVALLGEGKESESESDTDPYESEYARQFRSPKERKSKKKKQAAAEMDHSGELEKRPFTPSQLVAEVIVEDSITEELEAEAAMIEERRPSQNMQDYSNIPDIMVTEDIKSPILEEETDEFPEKMLYKVRTEEELHKASDTSVYQKAKAEEKEQDFQRRVQEQYRQKLEELKRAEVGAEYDDRKAPDSPDSFEMVEQPDISDEFVIIEEVAKEANEVDLGGQSIKIKPVKYEQKHDEDVEKIIIKSAPADPKLGSQLYKDDLNFEFEESPPTGASSSSEQQEESDSSETAAANKRWVEMQLTDNQLRYPYDLAGAVLEDIKEEDGEFEVGSSRISSFKDSFSSTPEYDVAARRYHSRGEHDDVSMSSLQEFESLEQAISLENRNRTHQGSTDSSNGSFTRRYVVRHSGSGTAPGDDVSVSSLKDFEGLENACIEAHLIEIKAREEAALLSRSDESNKSNGSDKGATGNVVVTKVTRTVTRTEVVPSSQVESIEALLKQKLEREEGSVQGRVTDIGTTELDTKSKIDSQDSEKDSIDSMEISKSHDMMTSSIESFDISKDATTRSDVDSLEIDKRHSRQESIESFGDEQLDLMTKFVSGGGVTLGDGLTTTTTTTTTSTDADGHEHTVTRVITTITNVGGGIQELPMDESGMSKDVSVDSLNMCVEQTTSSAGTTATYQTSAGNSQMSGSVTSCASSTLMEDSFPGVGGMSSSQMSASFWSHDESTVVEDEGRDLAKKPQQGH